MALYFMTSWKTIWCLRARARISSGSGGSFSTRGDSTGSSGSSGGASCSTLAPLRISWLERPLLGVPAWLPWPGSVGGFRALVGDVLLGVPVSLARPGVLLPREFRCWGDVQSWSKKWRSSWLNTETLESFRRCSPPWDHLPTETLEPLEPLRKDARLPNDTWDDGRRGKARDGVRLAATLKPSSEGTLISPVDADRDNAGESASGREYTRDWAREAAEWGREAPGDSGGEAAESTVELRAASASSSGNHTQ
mmetsp:Transcript_147582/g.411063  ORF Transcript_147582/g.411063 Transcript_147582/m.411063 type:complete len:252 (-) Transcript_147582:173-928(-)